MTIPESTYVTAASPRMGEDPSSCDDKSQHHQEDFGALWWGKERHLGGYRVQGYIARVHLHNVKLANFKTSTKGHLALGNGKIRKHISKSQQSAI